MWSQSPNAVLVVVAFQASKQRRANLGVGGAYPAGFEDSNKRHSITDTASVSASLWALPRVWHRVTIRFVANDWVSV
jgi:hypothetical protein